MRKRVNQQKLTADRQPELVYYPQSEDITINSALLEIKFRDFKEAVYKKLSIDRIITVVALWTPFFTADFKSLFGYSSESIEIGYFVFCFLVSIYLLGAGILALLYIILSYIPLLKTKLDDNKLKKLETNPENKVKQILKDCGRA